MADNISREAAMEIVKRTSGDYAAAFSEIRKLPAADVEPVRRVAPICLRPDEYYGKWLLCPSCGFDLNAWGAKFCGGCGAKMDLEEVSHEVR